MPNHGARYHPLMRIATTPSFALLGQVGWGAIRCASAARETDISCASCEPERVIQIIDGDTIETAEGPVRAYGVDTPEQGERYFSEATRRMGQLAGRYVRMEAGPRPTDDYGRILAYLYADSGTSIDEILIREGLATAWEPDGQNRDRLMRLEAQARLSGQGRGQDFDASAGIDSERRAALGACCGLCHAGGLRQRVVLPGKPRQARRVPSP